MLEFLLYPRSRAALQSWPNLTPQFTSMNEEDNTVLTQPFRLDDCGIKFFKPNELKSVLKSCTPKHELKKSDINFPLTFTHFRRAYE